MHKDRHLKKLLREKPERSIVVRFATSTFFAGIVSATLLGAGALYFKKYEDCRTSASALSETYSRINKELYERRYQLIQLIAQAPNIDTVKSGAKTVRNRYPEFKDSTIGSLLSDRSRIENRMELRDLAEIEEIAQKRDQRNASNNAVDARMFWINIESTIFMDIKASNFTAFKQYVAGPYFREAIEESGFFGSRQIVASCGLSTPLNMILSKEEPQILIRSALPKT